MKKTNLTNRKSAADLEKYNGEPKKFLDFKFRLETFLEMEEPMCKELLKLAEGAKEEIDSGIAQKAGGSGGVFIIGQS